MSENNKLTLADAMKYPNTKVIYDDDICEFTIIYTADEVVELSSQTDDYDNVSIEDCKLILRPLSSLTDEEKKEVDMIQRKFSLRALADDNDETYRKHFQRITDKYREWNIDIDGLRERGVAVYE